MNEEENIREALFSINHQLTSLQRQSLKEQLAEYVRQLMLHDFSRLVQLLYRVDVDEAKLKTLLQKNSETDTALLIAGLLITRQEEKMILRRSFKANETGDNEEKW